MCPVILVELSKIDGGCIAGGTSSNLRFAIWVAVDSTALSALNHVKVCTLTFGTMESIFEVGGFHFSQLEFRILRRMLPGLDHLLYF